MRIATLADIHGNLPALEAVQADMRQQGVEEVWLLGDQISRVPWHNEVLDLAAAEGWQGIYGNHELVIGALNTPTAPAYFADRERFSALYWTQEQMRPEHLTQIRILPEHLVIRHAGLPPVHLTHGVPGNPFRGVFPDTPDADIAAQFADVAAPLTIVGHTHRPLDRSVGAGAQRRRVINGGAVGLPYNGDLRAQYLILEAQGTAWQPIFRQVPYDTERVARGFVESGMGDALGAYGALHLRTVMTAQPWSSDFAWWLGQQPESAFDSVAAAVAAYLARFGPGHWAFQETLT